VRKAVRGQLLAAIVPAIFVDQGPITTGPSRLGSQTQNDGFRQPAGHIRATRKKIPRFLPFIYPTTMVLRDSLENGGHNWRDVVAASVIDRVS